MSHHIATPAWCFGETEILIALLVVAVIIAVWLTGNLESPFARKHHHPAQDVQWINNPTLQQSGVTMGYAPNGDTVIGVPASSTVTASNTTLSDPLNPIQDSISIAPTPAQPVPDDNTVTAMGASVTGSQDAAAASIETTTTSTDTTPASYFTTRPNVLVDANGDPLPRRYQQF